jgi:hypothetical protein
MYAVGGEAYSVLNPGFAPKVMEKYKEFETNKLKAKGAPQEEIDAVVQQFGQMMEMMKNPLFRFGIYLIEIIPVGLIITLLSAALLRKKELLSAPA